MSNNLIEFDNLVKEASNNIQIKKLLDACNTKDKNTYYTSFRLTINETREFKDKFGNKEYATLYEKCTKENLLQCFMQSLRYQLPIDSRNFCYLIPYGNICKLSLSYYGLVELAKRNKEVLDCGCFVVFEDELDKLKIIRTENGDKIVFTQTFRKQQQSRRLGVVVAWVKTVNGTRAEVYDEEYIEKAKNASSSKNSPAWNNWYREMAKKVALRNILKIYAFVNVSDVLKEDDDNMLEGPKEAKPVNLTFEEIVEKQNEQQNNQQETKRKSEESKVFNTIDWIAYGREHARDKRNTETHIP